MLRQDISCYNEVNPKMKAFNRRLKKYNLITKNLKDKEAEAFSTYAKEGF